MEFKDLFKKYEPPPGGLETLRVRLERKKKSILLKPAIWASASFTVVLLLITILIIQSTFPRIPRGEEDSFSRLVAQSNDPSLVRYGLVKAPVESVTIPEKDRSQLAALRVPIESEDVIFYWVSSLPSDQEPEEK